MYEMTGEDKELNVRIDHAAEARARIAEAKRQSHLGQDAEAIATLAVAEATLALVEQQRVANLIALGTARHANGSPIKSSALTYPIGTWSAAVHPEILEALGISSRPTTE